MFQRQTRFAATLLAFWLLTAFWPGSASADFTYQITVDTSSLNGQIGNLDFQLNPGDSSAEAVTAVITNFQSSGGILASSNALTGDASGLLPGSLTLDNGTALNDIFQGFTFGTSLSYDVTLSGPALSSPGGTFGSSFAFSLYDSSGQTPLLTTDPNGSVVTIQLNADGTTSVETFVSSVPAPPSMVLLLSALPAGFVFWRRSR